MNRIIFILTLSAFLFSQQAEVTNIQAAQRTDGSQIVDITYDITPDAIFTYFNVSGEVSMDGGGSYEDMQFATGDIGIGITAGTERAIVWGFGQQFNETYSNQVKIKINATSTAIIAGDSLEVPFEMITIPAGDYTYGENDVLQTISYDYDMMKYDVTDYDYVVYLIDEFEGEVTETCSDLTNLDGSPWYEEGGSWEEYSSGGGGSIWDCEWYVEAGCPDMGGASWWYNDAGYNSNDACCGCGGGGNISVELAIHSDGIYGNYPGDALYPAGEYLFLDFSQSKISYNDGIFEVEEGYVDHPITGVTWFGAWHFAVHYGLQLPSENEWEKAARGLTGYDYPWGNTISRAHANYNTFANLIFIDGVYFDGWIEFGYSAINGSPIMTTPVDLYDGNNSITNNVISDDLEHLVAWGLDNSNQYYYDGGENGSTLNIPFTIDNECTDVILGLWDTNYDQGGTYQITNIDQSQIISSNTIDIGTMGCSPQNGQEDEEWEDICENMGAYDHSGDTNDPWSVENNFYVIELECLDIGQYNFNYTAFSGNPSYFITDIIAFIDILNPISGITTISGASPYGLYDMAGNVSQWLNKFPISSISGIKGGNWGDTAENLVSWNIIQQDPATASNQIGFRCIKPISVNLNRNPREMLEEHKRRHRQPPVHPSERKINGN